MTRGIFGGIEVAGPDEAFVLHSGGTSPVRFDVVGMLVEEEDREYSVRLLLRKLSWGDGHSINKPTYIVGIETGGAILAVLLAERLKCRFAIVRKDGTTTLPKSTFGKKPTTRGARDMRDDVWLIDDVMTTGASMAAAKEVVDVQGYQVRREICLIDRRP